jgi:hypothetical protein
VNVLKRGDGRSIGEVGKFNGRGHPKPKEKRIGLGANFKEVEDVVGTSNS